MADKFDLVMWTKNGAQTLPCVLKRIAQVIPSQNVANRIIVDDQSTDQTRSIAEEYGWRVVPSRGSGISDGANTALELVGTERFASFEQDLLLASDWWPNVPALLNSAETAVASGLRFSSTPLAIRKLEEYDAQVFRQPSPNKLEAQAFGKTLDNTVYKTNIIRRLGGFPKLPVPAGIDTILNHKLNLKNLNWAVDYSVRSVHFRAGLRQELRHLRWYAECFDAINQMQTGSPYPLRNLYRRMLLGPARGFQLALKTGTPQIIYAYPLMRLSYINGIVASRRKLGVKAKQHG